MPAERRTTERGLVGSPPDDGALGAGSGRRDSDGALHGHDGDGDGAVEELRAPLVALQVLQRENAQLREALTSRIVIEQAKGVLAERYRLDLEQAFELLRRTARSKRMRIHVLAAAVVTGTLTPPEIAAVVLRMPRSDGAAADGAAK